jgi:hypothetical protein
MQEVRVLEQVDQGRVVEIAVIVAKFGDQGHSLAAPGGHKKTGGAGCPAPPSQI